MLKTFSCKIQQFVQDRFKFMTCLFITDYQENSYLITARKQSLRRLCFYTCLSVILFIGGSASVHAWTAHTSALGADTPQEKTPPGADTPSQEQTLPYRSRHPPGEDTPQLQIPPAADPPCTVHAARYVQQAGGTHPTGMHTCIKQ